MQPQHRATLTQPLLTTMRSADTELQNTIELRATVSEIAAPKPKFSTPKQKKDDFEALFKRIFKRKITTVKIAKIYSQITIAAWMQPLQYDLRCSAAKDNSITHAAAAPSNLDAATTHYNAICRHWIAKHNRNTRNSIENCSSKTNQSRRQSRKKDDFEALFKRIF